MVWVRWLASVAFLLIAVGSVGCAPNVEKVDPSKGYILYLNGAAGFTLSDQSFTEALAEQCPQAQLMGYDWTGWYRGLPAMTEIDRNRKKARDIAQLIQSRKAAAPDQPIDLVAHSAGTGMVVFALELLPPQIKVRHVVLLASALSPTYDLSKALTHVEGKVYAMNSPRDDVLPFTDTFGTIDRVYAPAAGIGGFIKPELGDPSQYAKLTQLMYDPAWKVHGYNGNHFSVLSDDIARKIIAPLLVGPESASPTSQPHLSPPTSQPDGSMARVLSLVVHAVP